MIATPCPRITSRLRVATPRRTHAAMSATFTTRHVGTTGPASRSRIGSGCSYSDSGSVSTHDFMSACRYAVAHSRRRVCDVRIGVTRRHDIQRHVRSLIAVIRTSIVAPYPRLHSCRRVAASRRTCAAVSVTFILASRAQRHVHVLIPVVRILIAALCSRSASCRRVAIL